MKARTYNAFIDSHQDQDYCKVLLFSLVCNQTKDIKQFRNRGFHKEFEDLIWYYLMLHYINDLHAAESSRSSVQNNLQTIQGMITFASKDKSKDYNRDSAEFYKMLAYNLMVCSYHNVTEAYEDCRAVRRAARHHRRVRPPVSLHARVRPARLLPERPRRGRVPQRRRVRRRSL